MKKFTFFCVMLLAFTALTYGQVGHKIEKFPFDLRPEVKETLMKLKNDDNSVKGTGVNNFSFENWGNSPLFGGFMGLWPNGWVMITGNSDAHRSTQAQNGQYAMHVESNVTSNMILQWQDTLIGGMSLTGQLTLIPQSFIQGEPYTEKMISLGGYLRGNLLANDSGLLIVQLLKNSQLIAFGGIQFGADDITESWEEFLFPMEYQEGHEQSIPDSIMVLATSTGVGIFADPNTQQPIDVGTLTAGSWVEFDNFSYNVGSTIEFMVQDENEDPIAGAGIFIYEDGSDILFAYLSSNEFGIATIDMGIDLYNFVVEKEGYISETGSFNSQNQVDPIIVTMTMHPGPQVLDRTPGINETMVALDAEVTITFTVDIDELDLDLISIIDEDDNELDNLVATINDATLSIAHDGFDYNTVYTVIIPSGTVKDILTDEQLAFDIIWSFTTINPIGIINGVDDIEVYFNTSEVNAIAALPATTTIEDILGETYAVYLAWTIDSYEAITPGDYNATGTFELPEGVHQTDPLTVLEVHAVVTVMEPPIIVDIDVNEEVEDIEVPYATTEAVAINLLVDEISISDSDGFEHIVTLDWTIAAYDGVTPGEYNATGTFSLPFGVDQTNPETDLEVHAVVTVMDPALITDIDVNNVVEDVEVPYATTEANAKAALAQQITIKDSYNQTYVVNLVWTIEDYNGLSSGNYNATGVFALPTGVYQTDPATVLEVTAIVTVLEKAIISEIDVNNNVQNVSVDYGTTENDAKAALAQQITIKDSYDATYIVSLTWSIDTYVATTPGNYNATGTFALPAGVYQTEPETNLQVTAIVTVNEGSSVDNLNVNTFNIYPNPANDFIIVENAENSTVYIINMLGEVVSITDNANTIQVINISNLANGTYFVRVNSEVRKMNIVK